ncbi:MAG: hypothetical protein IPN71_08960 [Fibrobacteres bacterium]|nr:hypothetical protein [Fibrobacterota bacterium]
MGIRNQLGLWNGNESLLKSCAGHAHKDSIHPDEASSLLIRGVWDNLHEDLSLTDFDTVSPANYFHEIDRTLRLAKSTKNTRYLASLPGWMYHVRRLSFFPHTDSARPGQLMEEARNQASHNGHRSHLALLYLTSHSLDRKMIKNLLDSQLLSNNPPIELPSYTQEGARTANFLLQPDSMLQVPPEAIVYFWQTLSRREFAAECFGSLYDKPFKNADDYQKWSQLRRANRLVHWAWKEDVVSDDFQELSSDPRKLLEALLLTDRFFRQPMLGEFPFTPSNTRSTAAFVHFMNYDDSAFHDLPYDKRLRESDFRSDSATMAWNAKANASSAIRTKNERSICATASGRRNSSPFSCRNT